MKNTVVSILLLGVVGCFGQGIDSTKVAELKLKHEKIKGLMESSNDLTSDQLREIQTCCAVADPLFNYLVANASIDAEDAKNYNVGLLCKKYEEKQQLKELKEDENQLKILIYDYTKAEKELEGIEDGDMRTIAKTALEEKRNVIDSLCGQMEESKQTLEKNEALKEEVEKLGLKVCDEFQKSLEETEPKKFIIIGDGDPVAAEELFSEDVTREAFYDVLNVESSTQLGTFQIPSDGAEINLIVNAKVKGGVQIPELQNHRKEPVSSTALMTILKDESFKVSGYTKSSIDVSAVNTSTSNSGDEEFSLPKKVRFNTIDFEIREGGLVDIRLQVTDVENNYELYFENKAPVALLNYTRRAKNEYLFFSNKFNDNSKISNEEYTKWLLLKIRLSDVLNYKPRPGNNFVPNDMVLTLPKNKEEEKSETVIRSYDIINDTSLKNLLDLRTYTDFLGLFGNESNGLFQIEGKADFYFNPFNYKGSALYTFKKVTPYIRYSRLEEGRDAINTIQVDENIQFDDGALSLLEKSNLEFGIDLNLTNFRLYKESPVWFSVHFPINILSTKIDGPQNGDDENGETMEETNNDNTINFTTVGYGIGAQAEVQRLRNFGLNLGLNVKWYSYLGEYDRFNLIEPDNLKTFSVNAEIFYYPGENENQSIFLRMRSFKNISNGNSSFQQLQFGYRFTLGMGNRKAND